jgi:hypothetical protein
MSTVKDYIFERDSFIQDTTNIPLIKISQVNQSFMPILRNKKMAYKQTLLKFVNVDNLYGGFVRGLLNQVKDVTPFGTFFIQLEFYYGHCILLYLFKPMN